VSWVHRVWNTFRRQRIQRDVQREVAFHLAERADQLRAEGLSDDEARRQARLRFGNVTLQEERTRDMDISLALDAVLRDLRYAFRALRRSPGFAVTVMLTLALGIGANSAVFSALDAVLIKPLPFPDADRLMELRQVLENSSESNIAPTRLEDWQRLNGTFVAISGYYNEDVSETSGEFAERIRRVWVAPRFVDAWGVPPARGRGFTVDDHRAGSAPTVLISHRYWRDRLGSDPDVLNRTVRVGRTAIRIVGVMPQSFWFPDRSVDLWSPVPIDASYAQSRQATWYLGIGRLKPGVTVEQARANLVSVQAQLGQQYGDVDAKIGVNVAPLKEATVAGARRSLWLLFGGVSVLLLITCTNIAALLLSRATHRQQEVAVRLSLGASQLAVVRQTLIETLVLALGGGLIGLSLAYGSIRLLRTAPVDLPRLDEIAIDWRIVAYTVLSAAVVAIFCGMFPAWRSARDHRASWLNDRGRAVVSTRYRLQWVLVGAQIALSVTLLVGAALLARSLQQLWRVEPGFNIHNVLAFRVSGNWAETTNQERLRNRVATMIEKLRALPGVTSVATTGWSLPGTPAEFQTTLQLLEAQGDEQRNMTMELRSVSAEYFETMQIPVLAGELCRPRIVPANLADGRYEVMVNRTLAERYFPARSPVGFHFIGANRVPNRITGVVADARERGLDREPGPIIYLCDGAPNPTPFFLVRAQTDPSTLAPAIRQALKEVDPMRAVYELGVVEQRVGDAFGQNRLRAILLVLFAATALLLASVGVYGTLSYAVNLRRREVALRLALGAVRQGVIRQFLGESLRIVGIATVCGLLLTVGLTRLLIGMLYGVSPNDPFILLTVVSLVVVVSAAAAFIPAMRASRLQAMDVLREI
jgi:predicted permease